MNQIVQYVSMDYGHIVAYLGYWGTAMFLWEKVPCTALLDVIMFYLNYKNENVRLISFIFTTLHISYSKYDDVTSMAPSERLLFSV